MEIPLLKDILIILGLGIFVSSGTGEGNDPDRYGRRRPL